MVDLSEKEVLKQSLTILRKVFKQHIKIERRQSGLFKNAHGGWVRVGKVNESDIGGWILSGFYSTKPIAIETKRSSFRPSQVYGKDKKRFIGQCDYLQEINNQGGVGFWINDPGLIYTILVPVLLHGARVSLDGRYCVQVSP